MALSAVCGRCGGLSKDTSHVVRDCEASKEVWLCLVDQNDLTMFFMLGLRE